MTAQDNRQSLTLEYINKNLDGAMNDLLAYLNSFIIAAADIDSEKIAFYTQIEITACHYKKYSKKIADEIHFAANISEFESKDIDKKIALKTMAETLIKFSKCCWLNKVPPAFELNLSITATANGR